MTETPTSLLQKIRLGEDSRLELKSIVMRGDKLFSPHRDGLADEIAAMANTNGGLLLLGVDDKSRDVSGIPLKSLPEVEKVIFEICEDSIQPAVAFHSYNMELPDTAGELQCVLLVEIPKSLFVHRSPNGYFRRQGSSKREMPPDVLARLFQQRSQARLIRFDEQAVPNTSFGDFDDGLWKRFVGDDVNETNLTLRKLSLLRDDNEGVERATVAGILLCSERPDAHLKSALIQAVRYRGTERDANYQLDAREITGPLDTQIRDAHHFVLRNMTIRAVKTPQRVETPQYDERAVFEAIVNAVAHRDYSIAGSKIRLFMFDDRLEIYSPGALPNTLTIDSIALRQSTRNELIASLLARCGAPQTAGRSFMMDKRGEGVPIIQRLSKELSGRAPEYRLIDDNELLLTIWAAHDA